jgi:hypothetical protein
MILAFMIAFFTLEARAEINPDDYISDKYLAGEYLIYDCQEGHWVCVMEIFSEECRSLHEEDKRLGNVRARCAPIEKMASKRSCFQRQLFLVGQNYSNRFCLLEPWRHKTIDF